MTMKNFVVRHKPNYSRTWVARGYFETAAEALAKYEAIRETYPNERVWVVDLMTDQLLADNHKR